ncbi:MAG: UDP-N-acetylmuramate--L-alanine ligase [Burkholderiales bacterium]
MRYKVKHVHFVGIGGSGMSGIAEVLINLGFHVSGSDVGENTATRRLRELGADVFLGHHADNVEGADVVVMSSAVRVDNPELEAARAQLIPVIPRAVMLAELMRLRQGIAVAGTHGKTTTTSLVASILAEAGMDPTFVIGGRLNSAGTHARLGSGEFLVAEADESDVSFLYLQPVIAVVTNIDQDHMESYAHSLEKLKQAFVELLSRLPFYGSAVLCMDDANVRAILPRVSKPVRSYGFCEDAQVRAVSVEHRAGHMEFDVLRTIGTDSVPPLHVVLNIPGVHNVANALAAICVAGEVGVPDAAIVKALGEFKGVGRRFQSYGALTLPQGGVCTLVDDYGHHPAEIKATLHAARGAYPGKRLMLAFQPHRYTRTRDLFGDFVEVLCGADALLLTEIYSAGEAPLPGIDGHALLSAVQEHGKRDAQFVPDVTDLPQAILRNARDGDLVLTMGAGSIGQTAQLLAHG